MLYLNEIRKNSHWRSWNNLKSGWDEMRTKKNSTILYLIGCVWHTEYNGESTCIRMSSCVHFK